MKSDKEYLYDLKDSIDKIIEYTSGVGYEQFTNSGMLQDAVVRRFDMITDACLNLSDNLKYRIDFIPWERIIDIKKKLVIDEVEVNTSKVWEIVKEDLPIFRDDIYKVIQSLSL